MVRRERFERYMLGLAAFLAVFSFIGCKKEAISPEIRKEKSITILEGNGIPYIEHLPVIAGEGEVRLRSKEEICDRAVCLALVASWANGMSKGALDREIEEYGVKGKFTPDEAAFMFAETRDGNMSREYIWRYEALLALLWSISYIDTLEIPRERYDTKKVLNIVSKSTRANLLKNAKLRTKAEILDQADLIYRLHWATMEAYLNGEPMPGGLDYDVVYERHYALNWLIRFQGQEWDDVGTDT